MDNAPATTPTQQLEAAEAARKDGDQNPKAAPVDKVAELEKQLAAAKLERAKAEPAKILPVSPTPPAHTPVPGSGTVAPPLKP